MSEDKRQQARTQGKYRPDSTMSGKEKSESRKRNSNDGREKSKGVQSRHSAEGISVEYQDNTNYSFKEFEKPRKPEELRFTGVHELSATANGRSKLIYEPNLMSKPEAEEFMSILRTCTNWYDKNIVIRDIEYPQPRLVAWYGPYPYTYSGATLEPAEMPDPVLQIKEKVERVLRNHKLNVELNSVLLNLYRDEKDSVAWHSDDEKSMGIRPTIASVSLGAVRKFEIKPNQSVVDADDNYDLDTVLYVNLTPGSLIVMDGCMQKDWMHRVPKEYHSKGPRINLTFRTVYPITQSPYTRSPQVTRAASITATPASFKKQQRFETVLDSDDFPPLAAATPAKKKFDKTTPLSTSKEAPVDRASIPTSAKGKDTNQNNLNRTHPDFDSNSSENYSGSQINYNLQEPEKDDVRDMQKLGSEFLTNLSMSCSENPPVDDVCTNDPDIIPYRPPADIWQNIPDDGQSRPLEDTWRDNSGRNPTENQLVDTWGDYSNRNPTENQLGDTWGGKSDRNATENQLEDTWGDYSDRNPADNQLEDSNFQEYQTVNPPILESSSSGAYFDNQNNRSQARDHTNLNHRRNSRSRTDVKARADTALDANAPTFVPRQSQNKQFEDRSSLHKMDLQRLAVAYLKGRINFDDIGHFTNLIFEELKREDHIFIQRDLYELDVLYEISDGNQTERNQEIILRRICSMVQNAYARRRQQTQPYYQRTYRGSDNYRGDFKNPRKST